jgi:Cys-tRNA(Pro)/Cys-tRNA(Cys) deacylase
MLSFENVAALQTAWVHVPLAGAHLLQRQGSWRARRPRPFNSGSKPMKTNAVRLLESLGVQYELREYEVDPDDLAAETVAAKIGMPPEQVFKTLLARGDRHGLCFAVVPANTELDLKALAAATGERKMELVPVKELLGLTGYIRGGVTVLGAKKAFPVFADETIQLWDAISISAGVRGTQMILRPEDYLRVTSAVMADIARGK